MVAQDHPLCLSRSQPGVPVRDSQQDGSLSTTAAIQCPASPGTLNFPSNTSSIFCVLLNQDPHTRSGQDLPHEKLAQRSNSLPVPSHQGALRELSLVPNRNILPTLRVPRCQWDPRETQFHGGSCQPDMENPVPGAPWVLLGLPSGGLSRGRFCVALARGALTSWHSRTRLVSSPAGTGDAPRGTSQIAL